MIIILAANGTLSDFLLSSFFDKFLNKTAPLSKNLPHSQ